MPGVDDHQLQLGDAVGDSASSHQRHRRHRQGGRGHHIQATDLQRIYLGDAKELLAGADAETDWVLREGDENTGLYVILDGGDDPTLIPVINITSAQLILGAGVQPTYVDQDVIDDQTPGDPIGIAGAPQTLPRPPAVSASAHAAPRRSTCRRPSR